MVVARAEADVAAIFAAVALLQLVVTLLQFDVVLLQFDVASYNMIYSYVVQDVCFRMCTEPLVCLRICAAPVTWPVFEIALMRRRRRVTGMFQSPNHFQSLFLNFFCASPATLT